MNKARHGIVICGSTLLIFFSLSTSVLSGTIYRCVNSQGSVMLTDNVPTDPDFKCTSAASYRNLTPRERAIEQMEDNASRARMRAESERLAIEINRDRDRRRAEAELKETQRQKSGTDNSEMRSRAREAIKEIEERRRIISDEMKGVY